MTAPSAVRPCTGPAVIVVSPTWQFKLESKVIWFLAAGPSITEVWACPFRFACDAGVNAKLCKILGWCTGSLGCIEASGLDLDSRAYTILPLISHRFCPLLPLGPERGCMLPTVVVHSLLDLAARYFSADSRPVN